MLLAVSLLLIASIVFSDSYDDNSVDRNYLRAIARGTDAPDGSHKHVGLIVFQIKLPYLGMIFAFDLPTTGYFAVHQGADGSEKFYFLTAAHLFDMTWTGTVPEYFTEPAKDNQFRLLSKGKITIHYGSVKLAEMKKFSVFANGKYQPNNPGEAHIVRISSGYAFDNSTEDQADLITDPNPDIAAIELTDAQKLEFVRNGGKFVRSKDDSAMKDFQVGEVCKVGGWGFVNESDVIRTNRLKEANIVVKERTYCTEGLHPASTILSATKFACFSTNFGRDEDPIITNGDSGAPVICGTGDGVLATMVTSRREFVVMGPTRENIFAFIKAAFYDT